MPDQILHQTDTPDTDEIKEVVAVREDEDLSIQELEGVSGGGGKGSQPGSSHTYHNSYSGSGSSNKD